MSDSKARKKRLRKQESIAIQYPCAYCGAKPGESCVTAWERTPVLPHADRRNLAL